MPRSVRTLYEELEVRGIIINSQKTALENSINTIEKLETALADADREVVRLANMYEVALRKLNHKTRVLRFPQVMISFKRFIDRANGKYNGVE